VVAEQENVGARIHPVAQPPRGIHRIVRRVVEIIEIIPEKNNVIVLLGLQPVIGIPRVVVKVGDDQGAHRGSG